MEDKEPVSLVAFSQFPFFWGVSCTNTPCIQSPLVEGQERCYIDGFNDELEMFSHTCDDDKGASGASLLLPLSDKPDYIVGLSTLTYQRRFNLGVFGSVFFEKTSMVVEEYMP